MAYLCIVASIPLEKVSQIRVPSDVARWASRVAHVSHLVVSTSTGVRKAIDGGTLMETDTWHPLRGFMFHEPTAVRELVPVLDAVLAGIREERNDFASWAHEELRKLLELFRQAADVEEAVVTHLDLTRLNSSRTRLPI